MILNRQDAKIAKKSDSLEFQSLAFLVPWRLLNI